MNQECLFRALEVIIRKYSKAPIKHLIDNYLRIKIAYNLPAQILDSCLKEFNANAALTTVFTNRCREEKNVNFSCIIVDHPHLMPLTHKILETVDNCIVIDPNMQQQNNIFSSSLTPFPKNHISKAIFLRTNRQSFESLTDSLDSYLSICQLFHSHIHLTLNCFEASPTLSLPQLMQQSDGDEFEGVIEDGYFRILEERASKITLEDLSEICEIKRIEGGQMFICEGGHDGLIVWVTQRFLPKLCASPQISMPASHSKRFLLFHSSNLGYKIFKKRQLMRQPLEELNLTTIIFNFDSPSPTQKLIASEFDDYLRHFFSSAEMTSQLRSLEEGVKHGQRICQLLQIDEQALIRRLLCP